MKTDLIKLIKQTYFKMKSFITQFKKAKELKLMLMYDLKEKRYMVSNNKNWLNWCVLIKNFK